MAHKKHTQTHAHTRKLARAKLAVTIHLHAYTPAPLKSFKLPPSVCHQLNNYVHAQDATNQYILCLAIYRNKYLNLISSPSLLMYIVLRRRLHAHSIHITHTHTHWIMIPNVLYSVLWSLLAIALVSSLFDVSVMLRYSFCCWLRLLLYSLTRCHFLYHHECCVRRRVRIGTNVTGQQCVTSKWYNLFKFTNSMPIPSSRSMAFIS